MRAQLDKSLKDQKALTVKLLKSETDKKKREKLEVLKKHIEDTMRQEDEKRMQDINLAKQQALESRQRTDQIGELEEFGEFLSQHSSDFDDEKSQSSGPSVKRQRHREKKANVEARDDEESFKVQTKDYVAATLSAWDNCPGIVKKQLDKQQSEIDSLQ
jgi:hypothetical protein